MSTQPAFAITFTQEEQVLLRDLQNNQDLFNALKALLTQGQFPGNAAVAVIRSQQFTEQLLKNTADQIKQVNDAASARSQEPAKANTKED